MKEYGLDRREHQRADAALVVSYRPEGESAGYDITQSKNLSLGGMLMTTNQAFGRGDGLALTIRVPFLPDAVELPCEVVGSKEIVRGLIYDTRVRFCDHKSNVREKLGEFVSDSAAQSARQHTDDSGHYALRR